jgi:hypothetical protein
LVVSYLEEMNPDFVRILQTVRDAPDLHFRVTCCQSASGLIQAVGSAFGGARRISRLDLHGHAGIGMQAIGDEVLANQEMDVLGAVEEYLTEDAEIRLLGCANAIGPECFEMLKRLQARQGRRTVYGCTAPSLRATDFDEHGLREEFAREWLVPVRSLHAPIDPRARPLRRPFPPGSLT